MFASSTDEDMHPVVGPTELEGFVVANGFSGHGFKLAPAVGGLVARWLTSKQADFDADVPLEFLSVERASLAVREKNVLA
jgi:glycine/D-amino acid oxidase-like deaminating enzyme